MKYIDLHSHLAWDLDDGIASVEDCEKLLSAAKNDSISKIAATPHFVCGKHDNDDIELFESRIKELKKIANNYDIEIYKGSELLINDLIFQQIQKKQIIPIENTRYVLCEFNVRKQYDEEYELIYDFLHELVLADYIPILAHVERYFNKKINISAIQSIIDMGCLLQMNTSSILYPKNQTMKRNIFELLNHNLIHIIATDSHRHTGKRSPNMNNTFTYLCKFYDVANLELLFYHNPLAVISNDKISATQFKKHKLAVWRLFR